LRKPYKQEKNSSKTKTPHPLRKGRGVNRPLKKIGTGEGREGREVREVREGGEDTEFISLISPILLFLLEANVREY
jgi:hypothetical protein